MAQDLVERSYDEGLDFIPRVKVIGSFLFSFQIFESLVNIFWCWEFDKIICNKSVLFFEEFNQPVDEASFEKLCFVQILSVLIVILELTVGKLGNKDEAFALLFEFQVLVLLQSDDSDESDDVA